MIIHVRRRTKGTIQKLKEIPSNLNFTFFYQNTLKISIMGNCCGSNKDDYEKYSPEIEQRISNSPDARVKA